MMESSTTYYPFGLPLDAQDPQTYRFGFNGMESDDEITGTQKSHYTAPFREYDTRIARRWNVDPVDKTHESSYAAFSGNPIMFIDPNGDLADWFQNENTGEVFYHPELREGDEGTMGMEGEGWVHMGENGMFGVNFSGSIPENMINPGEFGTGSDWSHIHESGSGTWVYEFEAVDPDASELVWQNNFEGVLFSSDEAREFMGSHGYEFLGTVMRITHHNDYSNISEAHGGFNSACDSWSSPPEYSEYRYLKPGGFYSDLVYEGSPIKKDLPGVNRYRESTTYVYHYQHRRKHDSSIGFKITFEIIKALYGQKKK